MALSVAAAGAGGLFQRRRILRRRGRPRGVPPHGHAREDHVGGGARRPRNDVDRCRVGRSRPLSRQLLDSVLPLDPAEVRADFLQLHFHHLRPRGAVSDLGESVHLRRLDRAAVGMGHLALHHLVRPRTIRALVHLEPGLDLLRRHALQRIADRVAGAAGRDLLVPRAQVHSYRPGHGLDRGVPVLVCASGRGGTGPDA